MLDMPTPMRAYKPSEWKALVDAYGEQFCQDASAIAETVADADAPFRRFLDWVFLDPDRHRTILRLYAEPAAPSPLSQASTSEVAEIVQDYLNALEKEYKENWPRRTQKYLSDVLAVLGERKDRSYPAFHRKVLPTRKAPRQDETISLSKLPLDALKGIPARHRDQAALDLIKDEALRAFEKWEAIFNFGQAVIYGTRPPAADKNCWNKIRRFLVSVQKGAKRGQSIGMNHPHEGLNLLEVWEKAGLTSLSEKRVQTNLSGKKFMSSRILYSIAFGCIGASPSATAALKAIFCACFGWNKEQIGLLPPDPYAFRTEEIAGLANEAFLVAYKARAGHYVNAYLERGFRDFTPDEEQLIKLWDEEVSDFGNEGVSLISDTSVLALFDRYALMVTPIRELASPDIRNRFFLALTWTGVTSVEETLNVYKLGPITSLKGVGYQTIRQSFVNVTRRRIGSLTNAKYATNNTNESTILAHYDDEVIQDELTSAQAFWQNCIQADLLTQDRELRSRFNVSEDEFEWFSNLSIISGISASLSIVPKRLSVTETGYFEFTPSIDSYIQIFLQRRSLLNSKRAVGVRRWQVQAVPLLAMLKAIRKHGFENGWGDMYREAVRQAFMGLKNGEIIVPRSLDIFK